MDEEGHSADLAGSTKTSACLGGQGTAQTQQSYENSMGLCGEKAAAALCLAILRSCHKAKGIEMTLEDPIQSLKGPSRALEMPRGAWGTQTTSLFLCVPSRKLLFFFCQSKEKGSPSPSNGSGPHYMQENPLGVSGGRSARNVQPGK